MERQVDETNSDRDINELVLRCNQVYELCVYELCDF